MTTKVPVSIIIPTLNEADYIGYLLYSLSRQTYKNFEVIISDGKSDDETLKIASMFSRQLPSLKVVSSSVRSPATQRNIGVQKAVNNRILFLDADTILPPEFLVKSLSEIGVRGLDLAQPFVYPFTQKVIDQYIHMFINWSINLTENFFPLGGGYAIFSTAGLHLKLAGFDERLKMLAEDTDYVTRAVKAGAKFGILKNVPIYMSVRRFDIEGRGGTIKNMILNTVYFTLYGKYEAQKYIQRQYGEYENHLSGIAKQKKSNLLPPISKKQFNLLLQNLKKYLGE